jgi:AAT family amino acid transporter/GABA permease
VVSLFLIVAVNPWTAVRSGESPFTLALKTLGIPGADTVMSAVILTAVLSSLNSAFYVSSRVLFILARHADAPQMLVRLNARAVPLGSVLIASAAGFLGIVAATEAPSGIFDFLVSASGALMIFVYLMIVAAQIKLRRRTERAHVALSLGQLCRHPRHAGGVDRDGVNALFTAGFERQLPHACRDGGGLCHRQTAAQGVPVTGSTRR